MHKKERKQAMIDENNCSKYEVVNDFNKSEEYYDEHVEDCMVFHEFGDALADIEANGGIPFPNIQGIITSLFEASDSTYSVDIAEVGGTSVSLTPYVGHDMYDEEIVISLGIEVWSSPDAEGYPHGGEIFGVAATWEKQCNPAEDAEAKRMLRWLYECLQNEWYAAYDEWRANGFSA